MGEAEIGADRNMDAGLQSSRGLKSK